MDLQSVFNYCKAVSCVKSVQIWSYFWFEYRKTRARNSSVFGNFSRSDMSDYFSKSELETSQALLQACSEIRLMNLHARETMYKLLSSYSSSRQASLQEAVHYSLPEHWPRKCLLIQVYRQNLFEFASQCRK